jgi:hypothetical protein
VLDASRIPNPKAASEQRWYQYYAGFSEQFVDAALAKLQLPSAALVFDPWNGAGTTTAVAARSGYCAFGADINPALVIVGRARSASLAHFHDVWKAKKAFNWSRLARKTTFSSFCFDNDPLQAWLGPASIRLIRELEYIGLKTFETTAPNVFAVDKLKPQTTLWYVALFLTVRKILQPSSGTNPTWIREFSKSRVLRPRAPTIIDLFCETLEEVGAYIKAVSVEGAWARTQISVGNSTSVCSLKSNIVDAVITSPPYCTRIDYAVYCAPELAIIGPRVQIDISKLRMAMIGSPLVGSGSNEQRDWGGSASEFLDSVWNHPSKASRGYYFNFFLKYFSAMQLSIAELSRVARPNCSAYIVVQGSFYKEIYLDLATILTEMFEAQNWKLISRRDFEVGASFQSLNPKARMYKKDRKAAESVIRLQATGNENGDSSHNHDGC